MLPVFLCNLVICETFLLAKTGHTFARSSKSQRVAGHPQVHLRFAVLILQGKVNVCFPSQVCAKCSFSYLLWHLPFISAFQVQALKYLNPGITGGQGRPGSLRPSAATLGDHRPPYNTGYEIPRG